MKAIYVEAFSGISGNMFLGALLNLGTPIEYITNEIAKMHLGNYKIIYKSVTKCGIEASYFNVILPEENEHHHEHDHDDHEHHHHHHHHDGEECDDPACECHHHHHHADDVFSSWGKETPKLYSKAALDDILTKLDSGDYGHILRAKGIVNGEGGWLEFDYVPEEHEVRAGHPDYTGRLCVIGAELKEDKLAELFGL